jgi:hypothetical protein
MALAFGDGGGGGDVEVDEAMRVCGDRGGCSDSESSGAPRGRARAASGSESVVVDDFGCSSSCSAAARLAILERIMLEMIASGSIDPAVVPSAALLSPSRSVATVPYSQKRARPANDGLDMTPTNASKRLADNPSPAFPYRQALDKVGRVPAVVGVDVNDNASASVKPAGRVRYAVKSSDDGEAAFRRLVREEKALFTDLWHGPNASVMCAVKSDDASRFERLVSSAGISVSRFAADRCSIMYRGVPDSLTDDAFTLLLGCPVLRVLRRKNGVVVVHVDRASVNRLDGVSILDVESLVSYRGSRMFEERRCFSCLGLGHIASTCTSSPRCSKCGSSDHKGDDCSSARSCVRCVEKNSDPSGHSFFEFRKCVHAVPN